MIKCPKCGHENAVNNAFCENCRNPLKPGPTEGPADAAESSLDKLSGLQTIVDPGPTPAPPSNETLEPGAVFADRYTIQSLIGAGGMGVVYRAKDKIGDREVALKLIRQDRLGGTGAVNRLISEGVLTQDIRHENVVAVYHVDQWNGQPFMSMEYVNGVSLREWIRKQVQVRADVPMKVAARIISEVLNGLQVAHAKGIIHRDLKPENIMLIGGDPTETAAPLKILDFGIARTGGRAVESGTGTGIGTPRYMAPEQITNPDTAEASADLYSLSTIFYELLVGVLPTGSWQPPSSGRADVPAGVDALIQSGLQNRPASRPQSVAEYREKLNQAMSGAIVRDDNIVGGGGGWDAFDNPDPAKRKKWLKIGGGIAAGVIAIAIIAELPGTDKPYDPPPEKNEIKGDDPPPPPPPPQPPSPAKLSGQWVDDMGAVLAVNVDGSGRFSGTGQMGNGAPLAIQGAFSGPGANYTVTDGNMALPGQLAWDGRDCHLSYRTMYPNGAIAAQSTFHVNHSPGGPCPAGW